MFITLYEHAEMLFEHASIQSVFEGGGGGQLYQGGGVIGLHPARVEPDDDLAGTGAVH